MEDVVISIPEGVEAAKVMVEVPSTVTSVTANGASVQADSESLLYMDENYLLTYQ